MSFEKIANNDSRIESLTVSAEKAEIVIKTWDEQRIRIRCNGFSRIIRARSNPGSYCIMEQ